jgi:hypothetical protein
MEINSDHGYVECLRRKRIINPGEKIVSFTSYLTCEMMYYPGAALFGAMVDLFAPMGNAV